MIRSGTLYKWVGLPGQYETGRYIVVSSLTASCSINGYIFDNASDAKMDADGQFRRSAEGLCTIPAADLVTAVEQGWLVEMP
jgi:hypothetical protein